MPTVKSKPSIYEVRVWSKISNNVFEYMVLADSPEVAQQDAIKAVELFEAWDTSQPDEQWLQLRDCAPVVANFTVLSCIDNGKITLRSRY